MDRHELITQARSVDDSLVLSERPGPGQYDGIADGNIELVSALEVIYGHGGISHMGGTTYCPTGHFYMVDRWIVRSDDAGFLGFEEYASADEASERFNELEAEYVRWASRVPDSVKELRGESDG